MSRKFKEKECIMCTGFYEPTSPKQKYCLKCKTKASKLAQAKRDKIRNRKKHNTSYLKVCPSCGVVFESYDSKKKYCGSRTCEDFRIKLKNKIAHKNRDKKYMLEKGLCYYTKNHDKCLLSKALKYRDSKLNTKEYKPRGKFKNSYDEVVSYIEKRNYKLLSKEYVNCKTKILLECRDGHEWVTTFHNFRDNGEVQGNRCATCYKENKYISKPEQLIRNFLEENFPNINVIYNDRIVLKPQELDFYFPDNNLAIEVCGLYWHGETSSGKPRNYHYTKMSKCFNNNIRLMTIFEDELHNQKDIVFSRIRQALGKPTRRIFARKCVVKELESKQANNFYRSNHVQGASTALVRYGLFYNDELVCVGSLGKIGRKHTSTETTIELKRFCTLPHTSVIGGVGKIFKRMKLYAVENNYTVIKSYCDMRYANIFKPVYEVLGFDLTNFTKYTPHYFKQQKRYRNFSLRKTPEERLTGKTEWQLRKEQGYDRIWDCGHRTYEYLIN